jgi:hypothetical protein
MELGGKLGGKLSGMDKLSSKVHRVHVELGGKLPYITIFLMIFLPKLPYIYSIYMVLANPSYDACMSCKNFQPGCTTAQNEHCLCASC